MNQNYGSHEFMYREIRNKQNVEIGRSMRSNHSTWDPRRPLYEELKPPPVPRRHYHGTDDCYHSHPPGTQTITSI